MTTILLSASGAPGSARLIRALHENGERTVRIVEQAELGMDVDVVVRVLVAVGL